MRLRPFLIALFALAILACAPTTPTSAPSSPPASPVAGFELDRAPADLGCDTIRVHYRQVVFRMDPDGDPTVTALTDSGLSLRTFWSPAFQGVGGDDPVVVDAEGVVVAADGEELLIPEASWPELQGYFVCPSPDALYILTGGPA